MQRFEQAPANARQVELDVLTNYTAANDLETIVLIDQFRTNWEMQMLFDVLTNARSVEALRLGTIEKLRRELAPLIVVAGGSPTGVRTLAELAHSVQSLPLPCKLCHYSRLINNATELVRVSVKPTPS